MINLSIALEDNAFKIPNNTAIISEGKKFSYKELNQLSNKVANIILDLGIKPGDSIALQSPNIAFFPIIYYGILKMGGVVVPMKRPKQTEENTIVPLDEFEGKISNAIQGIRGGMDKDLMIEMLENQRQLLGIPEDKAKFAVQDYMSRFMRGMK